MDHIPGEAWVEADLLTKKPVVLVPPLTTMLHGLPDNKDGVSQTSRVTASVVLTAKKVRKQVIHDGKVVTSLTWGLEETSTTWNPRAP